MKIKTTLATIALALAVAGTADAQQPQPGSGGAPAGGMVVRQSPGPMNVYFGIGWSIEPSGSVIIDGVQEGSPAAEAGLQAGDVLLTVDGREPPKTLPIFPGATPGREYKLRVKRGSEEKEIVLVAAAPPAQRQQN